MSSNDRCACNDDMQAMEGQTPQVISNPPGLPAISYRVGVYQQFRQSMVARIGDLPALHTLKTRSADDFTLALIDAWAMVADVVSFYQERTANESYRRTATERGSLLDLSHMVGYALQPGVAADTYLAFLLDTTAGSPEQTMIDIGNSVQSLPGPGEEPQTFETTEAIIARPEWNAISPIATQSEQIYKESETIVLQGISTNLHAGDVLLLVGQQGSTAVHLLKRVKQVVIDTDAKKTTVVFQSTSVPQTVAATQVTAASQSSTPSQTGNAAGATTSTQQGSSTTSVGATTFTDAFQQRQQLNDETVRNLVLNQKISQSDLEALALVHRWSTKDVLASASILSQRDGQNTQGATGVTGTMEMVGVGVSQGELLTDVHVYALRLQAPLFGYATPQWQVLPVTTRENYAAVYKTQNPNEQRNPNNHTQWPDWPVVPPPINQLDLGMTYTQVLQDSWVVVRRYDTAGEHLIYTQVETMREVSVTDFMQTNRVTRLTLRIAEGDRAAPTSMSDIRQTTVYMQSEELLLADVPMTTPVQSKNIWVNGKFEGLSGKRFIVVSGQRQDLTGIVTSELATLVSVTSGPGNTTLLTLEADLADTYVPSTVTINANVVKATQGETVEDEVLGSGDASQPYQRFTLQQGPLTYVQAATTSGRASTLQVSVDGIEWKEVGSLVNFGAREHVYATRIEDDGSVTVQFGDGEHGSRLSTGEDNVVANYRKGSGQQGLVKSGQLSLLLTRPLGVKGVFNPLAATGAIDAETPDDARKNALTTIQTAGRVVSQGDYEQFVNAFTGVAKTQATLIWNEQARRVYITLAGTPTPEQPNGTPLTSDSPLFAKIASSLKAVSDPAIPFKMVSYRTLLFKMKVYVATDPTMPNVLSAVEQRLRASFSFDARTFGQAVTRTEVVSVIQTVPGVITARIDALYRLGDSPGLYETLEANSLHLNANGQLVLADLLILSPIAPFDALEELS